MWIWSNAGDLVGCLKFTVGQEENLQITEIYGVSGEFPLISIRFLAVPPSDYSGQPSKICLIYIYIYIYIYMYAAFRFQGNKGETSYHSQGSQSSQSTSSPPPDIHPTLSKAEVDSLLASSAVLPPC